VNEKAASFLPRCSPAVCGKKKQSPSSAGFKTGG